MRVSTGFLACIFFTACQQKNELRLSSLTQLAFPDTTHCLTPHLTVWEGHLFMSYLQISGDSTRLLFTQLNNDEWTTPKFIAGGNDWFVNWADYPGIAIHDGRHLIAWYLQKSDTAAFAYDVMITASKDGGNSWSQPRVLHNDSVKAEHGFVSCVPEGDGYFITWLDGRKAANNEEHAAHGHHGEMTLRCARLSLDGTTLEEWEADGRVCDCCQTATGIAAEGPVVIYRNRTDDEIRDMHVLRMQNNQFVPDESLHDQQWKTDACPVNGPRLAIQNNKVAVAYFGAPQMEATVHMCFSKDGGKAFAKPVRLDHGNPSGRVAIAWLNNEQAAATWLEDGQLWMSVLNENGELLQNLAIAHVEKSRSSGFPQLAAANGQLLLAVTNPETRTIDTYRLPYGKSSTGKD